MHTNLRENDKRRRCVGGRGGGLGKEGLPCSGLLHPSGQADNSLAIKDLSSCEWDTVGCGLWRCLVLETKFPYVGLTLPVLK